MIIDKIKMIKSLKFISYLTFIFIIAFGLSSSYSLTVKKGLKEIWSFNSQRKQDLKSFWLTETIIVFLKKIFKYFYS